MPLARQAHQVRLQTAKGNCRPFTQGSDSSVKLATIQHADSVIRWPALPGGLGEEIMKCTKKARAAYGSTVPRPMWHCAHSCSRIRLRTAAFTALSVLARRGCPCKARLYAARCCASSGLSASAQHNSALCFHLTANVISVHDHFTIIALLPLLITRRHSSSPCGLPR